MSLQTIIISGATFTVPNDATKLFLASGAIDQTVTIPSGLNAWAVGDSMTIVSNVGPGRLTLVEGAGVSIISNTTQSRTEHRKTVNRLINIGPDMWALTQSAN